MNRNATILICDDDEDDLYLIKTILEDIKFTNLVNYLHDGTELMSFLNDTSVLSSVGLILLDLNMPKMSGREVLAKIKSNPELRRIPIIILTTSDSAQDIQDCYSLGANCFITKPSSYEQLKDIVMTLTKFWISLCHLPINRTFKS